MDEIAKILYAQKRREFLKGSVLGLGSVALGSLLGCNHPAGKIIKDLAATPDENKPLHSKFCTDGKTGYLPVPKRRAIANGVV